MKGDNLFRAKNEAGEYELVTLTVGDFESILLKSALLQQAAYKRFKQARDRRQQIQTCRQDFFS